MHACGYFGSPTCMIGMNLLLCGPIRDNAEIFPQKQIDGIPVHYYLAGCGHQFCQT